MIGVIADDLTGAAEIGAVGWRYGLRAEIVVSGEPSSGIDLVCMDTDSRSCGSDEAGRRAANAAAMLRQVGAKWIYKKVDSVLRGQVTAEVEAIMKELGVNRALLAPANPSLGRTIHDEAYFVRGQPIHETEFARDPEHPRKSAHVLDLLARPTLFPICVSRPEFATQATGIVIVEVGSPADLRLCVARKTADTLPVGGAEFFGALLVAAGHTAGKIERNNIAPNGRELFLCGSPSESSFEFIRVARQRGTPVFSLPAGLAEGAEFTPQAAEAIAQQAITAFRSHPRVILNVGLPPVHDRTISSRLMLHLVQVAEAVLRHAEVGQVYAEGGATAAALLRRMDWQRLEVVQELSPGVATLTAGSDKSMRLTIKPGSYAWPAALRNR